MPATTLGLDVPRHALPPEITDTPIAAAAGEYRRLLAELDTARREFDELEAGRPRAEAADRKALADAMAAGKKDPGNKTQDKLAADLAAVERRITGLADATTAAFRHVREQIDEHGAEWQASLGEQLEAARRDLAEHLAAAGGACSELDRLVGRVAWIRDAGNREPGARFPASYAARTRGAVQLGATPWAPADLLAALAGYREGEGQS
jgi:hypothetical protein